MQFIMGPITDSIAAGYMELQIFDHYDDEEHYRESILDKERYEWRRLMTKELWEMRRAAVAEYDREEKMDNLPLYQLPSLVGKKREREEFATVQTEPRWN